MRSSFDGEPSMSSRQSFPKFPRQAWRSPSSVEEHATPSPHFGLKPRPRRRRRRCPPSLCDRADFPQARTVEREGEAAGRAVAPFSWEVWNLATPRPPGPPRKMIRVALEKWSGSVDLSFWRAEEAREPGSQPRVEVDVDEDRRRDEERREPSAGAVLGMEARSKNASLLADNLNTPQAEGLRADTSRLTRKSATRAPDGRRAAIFDRADRSSPPSHRENPPSGSARDRSIPPRAPSAPFLQREPRPPRTRRAPRPFPIRTKEAAATARGRRRPRGRPV